MLIILEGSLESWTKIQTVEQIMSVAEAPKAIRDNLNINIGEGDVKYGRYHKVIAQHAVFTYCVTRDFITPASWYHNGMASPILKPGYYVKRCSPENCKNRLEKNGRMICMKTQNSFGTHDMSQVCTQQFFTARKNKPR